MFVSPEWLLAFALVAVYLFDSAHFLCIGEAVISTRSGALRRLSFGSSFELGGRRPYLPNPLTPCWPELRVEWDTSGRDLAAPKQVITEMQQHLRAAQPIGWFATGCTGLIVIVAPLALVTGYERVFIASALLCVVCAVPACVLVLRRRRELGHSGWQAVSLIVVALVCLPCSGNLARAVSIKRRWTLPASELPSLGFDTNRIARIETELREMLARAQRLFSEDSVEYILVSAQLKLLEARLNERH
jgi:hypothetical protein